MTLISGEGRFLTLMLIYVNSILFAANASIEKSPKIITNEGNVILEAGINKNLTICLKGESRLFVNDLDLMKLLIDEQLGIKNTSNELTVGGISLQVLQQDIQILQSRLLGRHGITARLSSLVNRTTMFNSANVLRTYETKLTSLVNRVASLMTKLNDDSCKTDPCENGGTCIQLFDNYLCKCSKGLEGPTCATDVNECALFAGTDLGCQNGAQCINQFGSYSCICVSGWHGTHCTQRETDCRHSSNTELCGHGTCVNINNNFGYRCLCEQGWTTNGLTPSCNVDIDECSSIQCSTKCINLPGSFKCSPCEDGYTGNGMTCRDIDECAQNNGGCSVSPFVKCINSYGSYHCGDCPIGWSGDGRICTRSAGASCERNNICHPTASCSEVGNSIVCSCPLGQIGNGVGPNGCRLSGTSSCSSNPCLNGGSCMDTGSDSYLCLCPQGFKPPNCQPISNPCATNPCHNGGTCRRTGTSFTCDCIQGYTGRQCSSQMSRCGQSIRTEQGNLKYPLTENLYRHNSRCFWYIRTNETKVLNITFTKFDIEDSTNCQFDFLQIRDGRNVAAPLIGRFCGSSAPMGGNIITTTNYVNLWFRSDNTTAKAGFELLWTSIDPICGGVKEFDSHETIVSPGSPGNYPRNRDCKWHLKVPDTKRIKLVFFSLNIEKHSDCSHDYLEITDAVSESKLEIFCNSSNPSPFTVPSNEIFIHFHSDNEGTDVGFQIHASTVERIPGCGGTYSERTGQIISPVGFEGSISCEYTVRYPIGLRIQLDVVEFKMGDEDCIEIFDVNSSEDKISTGKWCGGMHLPTFKSKSNIVQINYHSAPGGTLKLNYGTICEYTFENRTGTITSPNYPSPYPSGEICIYEIIGEPHQIVALEIIDMDIENENTSTGCLYDYLTISDGTNETAAGPFCGKTIPARIVTSTNLLKLTMSTDSTNAGKGFKANYALIDTSKNCGGLLRKSSGVIRLPSDEGLGSYKDDLTCSWTIMAPEAYGIELTWESFSLEESSDCSFDYVEIFDSDEITSDGIPVHRFCGKKLPPALVSHSNIMTLKFISDSSFVEDGFVARYSFVDVSKLCSGNIFSPDGRLTSLNWPNEYPNNLNCSWTISVKPFYKVQLLIYSFDLEDSENCTNDWLEIRNGGSMSSPFIGRYCGKTIPSRIQSFTHQMHLSFNSNSQIAKSGFRLEWEQISTGCGGYLTADHGSIASPSYPQNFANDVQCEWKIRVSKGSSITMLFEDISLEKGGYDFIDIFDGPMQEKPKIGRYIEKPNNPIETTGNSALIRFQSDSSNTDRGFYLTYVSNCNRILNSTFGSIESPNFGSNNPSIVNCIWTIQAPEGSHISMEFAIVGKKDNSPKLDYVYIMHGDGIITRLAEAKRIESNTSEVRIQLNSTSIYFSMEYVMKGCIASFHRPTGEFASPSGHPISYPKNTECRWYIETEIGKAIELTFTELDIEASVNCTLAHIEVWNTDQMSHGIGKFCGKRSNLTVTSTGHSLFMRFIYNYALSGRGFKANYRTIESKCGGKLISPEGSIQSLNYPNKYDSNLHCEWYIEVSQHSTMTLTVEELDLEDDFPHCKFDSIKIYLDAEVNKDKPWKNLCGQNLQTEKKIRTTSNLAVIVFETNANIELKGFKISFKENCGKRIVVNDTGRTRFYHSEVGEECLWVLVAEDQSKHVTLTSTHVQLHHTYMISNMSDSCDGVMIYDGDFTNTSSINPKQKFCNKHAPAVTSLGHALTMKIDTHYIDELEIYYSIMDNNCGGSFDSLQGTFASALYPNSYPINIECIWEIKASEGNWLSLTIQQMDIENTEDCNADYLEVREGSSSGRIIGVFCGGDVPSPLLGFKSLWIKFRSDDNFVGKGFIAEYNYAFHNELNGNEGIIESPRYPLIDMMTETHSWRISVPRGNLILLSVDNSFKDINGMQLFNGYDAQAEEIQIIETSNLIRSDTNYLYFRLTIGIFRFHWYSVSKEFMASNKTILEESLTPCNKIISVGDTGTIFQSPGYPEGYESNLNCSWTLVPIDPASHAVVKFQKIDLEDQADCLADSVNIYSSTDMTKWKFLQKSCKTKSDSLLQIAGDKYLKIEFLTDYAVNKTGFSATATSVCGSILTEPTAVINVTKYIEILDFPDKFECVWQIQVKTGRRIKITFLESKLESSNDPNASCRAYILLKNGFSEHSPNLGSGKYCNNNISDIPITSSNEAYVKLYLDGLSLKFCRISYKYEEVMNECMQNIELNENQNSLIVQSENYPNIPHSHSMCVWKIRAPIHRLLAIHFIDSINLKVDEFCDAEYIELNDGISELSPVIGRFCGKSIPNTQYSSGNNLRITFFTDIAEPSGGFKANISLGICGGTYRQQNGTISQPNFMSLYLPDKKFSCDYYITVSDGFSINLTLNGFNLPESENCSETNHLTITPVLNETPNNATESIVICGESFRKTYIFDTNTVRISYQIVLTYFNSDEFSFIYSSIGHRCDQLIEAESGILKSPGYMNLIDIPMRCNWKIKVPKGRRIKVEFLDFSTVSEYEYTNTSNTNLPKQYTELLLFSDLYTAYNDFDSRSVIRRFSSTSPPTSVIYSTDNTISISVFEVPKARRQGLKIKFSSDEETVYCDENFDKTRGDVHFRASTDTNVYCSYNIDVKQNETFAVSVSNIDARNYGMGGYFACLLNSPLTIQDMSKLHKIYWFCRNRTDSTLRMPYPIKLDISSSLYNDMKALDLTFYRHNCGGVFRIANELQFNQPNVSTSDYGRMDCAWQVLPNPGDLGQIEVSLSVDFQWECDEEYLVLYSKVGSPHLGKFCNQTTATNLVSLNSLFIEYHTSNYTNASKFNLTAKHGDECGGELKYPFRSIDFRKQYQNNVECVWTIRVNKEYHIGVQFTGRFFIESSPNCTKDYLLIQEQSDDEWKDIQRVCGRTPPVFVNTTTNAMRLIFRSDESLLGDGFTANFTRNCGGIFYASKDLQQLSSPNYPLPYDSNLYCNYTIHPSKPDVNFLVQFKDFVLETSPTVACLYDKLTVYTNSHEEPLELCGTKDQLEFRSSNPISFVFTSDHMISRKGFQLQFGEQECGGKITSNTVISTPKQISDNRYPPSSVCVWNIIAPEDSKIIVKFEKFDFEGSYACDFDYVEMFSGKLPVEDQRVAKLCGNLTGALPNLSIKSNMAVIRSISDQSQPSIGFEAIITFVKNCDRNITLKELSDAYSLDTFANGYDNNLNCEILFTTEPGRQLKLEFKSFHTEESSNCDSDYVMVRDGGGPFADEIGKFCGHTVPNSVISSRSTMFVNFVTDSSDTSTGFSATVTVIPLVCGAHELHIEPNKSVVISIGGDGNYLPNLNCFWRVRSDASNIRLDFEKIDIQGPDAHGVCAADYLKIYNKKTASVIESVLGTDLIYNKQPEQTYALRNINDEHIFCGNGAPEGYFTNTDEVFIKFFSDSTIEKSGFKIIARTSEGCFKNYTSTQGRILMETTADCNLYINAPQNYSISLYFNYLYLDFGTDKDCKSDYIEVFDEQSNSKSEKSIRKLCDVVDPSNSIFSSSNKLRIKLAQTGILNNYDITFLASDKGPGCGGDLYNYAGVITSPFYPENARNNSDCLWNIRVPNNMAVVLQFRVFDLGSKVTCHSDYLEILEPKLSNNQEAEVMRKFCGDDTPWIYTARQNTLSIRFRKTVNFDGTGWVIIFTGIRQRFSLI